MRVGMKSPMTDGGLIFLELSRDELSQGFHKMPLSEVVVAHKNDSEPV